jgi:hypothetical protein
VLNFSSTVNCTADVAAVLLTQLGLIVQVKDMVALPGNYIRLKDIGTTCFLRTFFKISEHIMLEAQQN